MTIIPFPDQSRRPNILFLMTDQQRFDSIAALGNPDIYTPNFDRLVARGAAFTRCYSPSPICVPARYTIRTGRTPLTTGCFQNEPPLSASGDAAEGPEARCGEYLARAMTRRGYRTFGIGKFHTLPMEEDLGYETYLRCEELDGYPDAYHQFLAGFPAYAHIEQLHGERTEMYYQPQCSPLPAQLTSENWVAERAIEQIGRGDGRPYFGFVSFVGPHPPLAPPAPFHRMYDPDRMRGPVHGPDEIDFMDERVRWNRHYVFAEDLSEGHIRTLRARYYGEISYIDSCVGKILDAVEAAGEGDRTLICFFSDHGDYLGDHQAVQKENFFEESAHVPMLVSWPGRIPSGLRCADLVTLTDLFGIATSAAGEPELRDGIDVLGLLEGRAAPRERVFGLMNRPGELNFRIMAREDRWKYIFHANGGGELLFDLNNDPREHCNLAGSEAGVRAALRAACVRELDTPMGRGALEGGDLRAFPRTRLALERCYQMNRFRGVRGFPAHPADVLARTIACEEALLTRIPAFKTIRQDEQD